MTPPPFVRPAYPWGRSVGFLAASLIVLVGVVRNLDPDVVLLRASVGGLVLGLLAAVVARSMK